MGEKTSIRMKFPVDRHLVLWGTQFLRECTPARARANTLVKLRLAQYSQRMMDELADEEGIDYQQTQRGAVYLYRDAAELAAGASKMQLMREHGQEIRTLSFEEVVALDPAFAPAGRIIAGALYAPTDAAGNSKLFTEVLTDRCRALGVEFSLGVTALRFTTSRTRAVALTTTHGDHHADQFVVANGVGAPLLAASLGQRLPVYPAKGYSLTAPVADPAQAPTLPGVDEKTLVAWSRMGDEVRMSSTAEFVGYDRRWKLDDFSNILATGREMFGDGVRWDQARMRSCLRPMTPDGPPIIGRSKIENVAYNTGHGHMGWTMAVGSSLALRDLLRGRTPTLDPEPMRVRSLTFA